MIWFWASAALAGGDCAAAKTNADVDAYVGAAERARSEGQERVFQKATAGADAVFACLAQPIEPTLASRYHVLRGLPVYADIDSTAGEWSFAAARALGNDGALLTSDAPAYRAFMAAKSETVQGRGRRFPRPVTGRLFIDGTASRYRPADRAAVVQVVHPGSALTFYVYPQDPLPDYSHRRVGTLPDERGVPLAIGAGVAAIGAVALLVAGSAVEAELLGGEAEPSWTLDDVEGLRSRANGLYATGHFFAALSVVGLAGATYYVVF